MRVLYSNSKFCIVHKMNGEHVHPPEDKRVKVNKEDTLVYILREQLGQKIFPVHRLDAGTEGLMIFALDSQSAAQFQKLFQDREIKKKYQALVRGHFHFGFLENKPDVHIHSDTEFSIEIPLESDSSGELLNAHSTFKILNYGQTQDIVGKQGRPARFSWLELQPITGRYHQLRRHLNRVSHPIMGDRTHGDCHYNKYMKTQKNIEGLCLWATELSFKWGDQNFEFKLEDSLRLQKVQEFVKLHSSTSKILP